ncbi:MAG: hypothetical protein H6642_15790 [Caldilineaceae bacterium]|nr:hypothetical protein [Caldilineaceae bacterium]
MTQSLTSPSKPPAHGSQNGRAPTRSLRSLDGIWPWLVNLRVALTFVIALLLFAVIALMLPQLPDTLRADPAEAGRRLLAAGDHLGALGRLLVAIGFFDLLHSPLFQAMLAVITLLLMLQCAYLFGVVRQLRQIGQIALEQAGVLGQAISLPSGRPIYRLRRTYAKPESDENAADENGGSENRPLAMDELPTENYPMLSRTTVTLQSADAAREEDSTPQTGEAEDEENESVNEDRLLAMRRPGAAWLKLLLPAGLLLIALAIWLFVRMGWELTTPVLAPGDTYRYVSGDLELRYDVTIHAGSGAVTPLLFVERDGVRKRLDLSSARRLSVNGALVAAQPADPALLVRARESRPLLAQPGQTSPSAMIGLLFPGPGSEQALLLPRQGAGLRLVRGGTDEHNFLVELYARNSTTPEPPLLVEDDEPRFLMLDDGAVIDLLPIPSLRVTVRRLPGVWLLLPGLLLTLAGLPGFRHRPGFALFQDAPWGMHKRVLIAQSDDPAVIAQVRTRLQSGENDAQP